MFERAAIKPQQDDARVQARFDRVLSGINNKSPLLLRNELYDLLTANPALMFQTFSVKGLDDVIQTYNLVRYAVLVSSPELLQFLYKFVSPDQQLKDRFLTLAHAQMRSGTYDLSVYHTLCQDYIQQKGRIVGYESPRAVEEHIAELRLRIPLALPINKQYVLFLRYTPSYEVYATVLSYFESMYYKEVEEFTGCLSKSQETIKQFLIDNPAPRINRKRGKCTPYQDGPSHLNSNNHAPVNADVCLSQCKEETRRYLLGLQENEKKNMSLKQRFEALDPTDEEKEMYMPSIEDYEDLITGDVISMPVLFEGVVFDWPSIINTFKRDGEYYIPFAPHSERKFKLNQLEPGRTAEKHISDMIDLVQRVRDAKARRDAEREIEKSEDPEALVLTACQNGNAKMIEVYLTRCKNNVAKLNAARDRDGRSAIELALLYHHANIFERLLNVAGITTGSNLMVLAMNANRACFNLMRDHERAAEMLRISEKPEAILLDACAIGDLKMVRLYLSVFKDEPEKINAARDKDQKSAPHLAMANQRLDILKELLAFPQIDLTYHYMGMNLLMCAVTSGVEYFNLLSSRFNINDKMKTGNELTVLMIAMNADYVEIVVEIFKLQPDLTLCNSSGMNALDMLKYTSQKMQEVFFVEMKKGMEAAVNADPFNAAYIETCMKVFGDKIAGYRFADGMTFLFKMVERAPVQVAELAITLLKEYVNDVLPVSHMNLIHLAAKRNSPELVRALLNNNCRLAGDPDAFGKTPLLYAAKGKYQQVMQVLLLEGKVNPKYISPKGKTAMHYVTETVRVATHEGCANLLANNMGLSVQSVSLFKVIEPKPQVMYLNQDKKLK